jgi:hypothetical protein
MVKNDFKTGQVKKNDEKSANGKSANNKSATYRSIATVAVKEAQRDNKERRITNWYLIDGELVNDRASAKVSASKSTSRAACRGTAVSKKAKSTK